MQSIRTDIEALFNAITPHDEEEKRHLLFVKEWIQSGAELFRKETSVPDPHLAVYFIFYDADQKKLLLVDHKKAELWIPAGGHVEPGEHPQDTVKRELLEELGVKADFLFENPFFVTVCQINEHENQHTDVSLWYVLKGKVSDSYQFDQNEFYQVRWFSKEEIPYHLAEPHMERFIKKLELF